MDLSLRGVRHAEQLGLRLYEGAKTHILGGHASGDRAGDNRAAAIARDIRSARSDLSAPRLGRCDSSLRLGLLIIDPCRHFLFVEVAFPSKSALGEQIGRAHV